MLTHWAPIIHFTFEVTAAVLSQLTGPHTSKVQCSKIILLKLIVIFFLNLCLEYEVWSVMAQGSTYCSVTNGFLAAPSHDPYLILLNTLKRSCWWGSCCVILVASTPRWSLTWVWGELRIFQCPKSSLLYASIPRKRLGGGALAHSSFGDCLSTVYCIEEGLVRRYCPWEGDWISYTLCLAWLIFFFSFSHVMHPNLIWSLDLVTVRPLSLQ